MWLPFLPPSWFPGYISSLSGSAAVHSLGSCAAPQDFSGAAVDAQRLGCHLHEPLLLV